MPEAVTAAEAAAEAVAAEAVAAAAAKAVAAALLARATSNSRFAMVSELEAKKVLASEFIEGTVTGFGSRMGMESAPMPTGVASSNFSVLVGAST